VSTRRPEATRRVARKCWKQNLSYYPKSALDSASLSGKRQVLAEGFMQVVMTLEYSTETMIDNMNMENQIFQVEKIEAPLTRNESGEFPRTNPLSSFINYWILQ
jgi:hypothetical protein